MRHESTVTSLSWIPSDLVPGMTKLAFEAGITHYDVPPPDRIDDVEALRATDRFRFLNRLSAWIEVQNGQIRAHGYGPDSGGVMGSTTVSVGPARTTFRAFSLPDIQKPPVVGDGWVRFVQTTGGRTGLPSPRRVRRRPFVQFRAPLVWTTMSLTLHADGRSDWDLIGASTFPRHWVYGTDRMLKAKVAMTGFRRWWRTSFGRFSPWGREDSPAMVTAAESALERQLSSRIMSDDASQPRRRVTSFARGTELTRQGEKDDRLFLLLDGVVGVDVDGRRLAELGPGAVLGERAVLEGGTRTATLTAVTPCRVVVLRPDAVAPEQLTELLPRHNRESVPY